MKITVYQRVDGLWAWRAVAENGQVVATDGSQGYVRRQFAVEMAKSLFPDAEIEP